jgi:hypothetical protein
MRKSIAATAIIAAAAATASCGFHRGGDSGPTVSRDYPVGAFQKIEVAGPYDVEVRTGSNPSVAGKGSEKLLEQTRVEVHGDTLSISPDNHKGWFHMGWHSGKAHFVVTVPQLRAATIAGSGGIKVDRVAGDSFEGTVAGSGALLLASAEVQSLKLSIGGSGAVSALGGSAKSAEYDIAGSGGIDAAGLSVERAKVSIAGSGSVKAKATGTAQVDIMGSGDVAVSGGAKCSVSKAGSGSVHCA